MKFVICVIDWIANVLPLLAMYLMVLVTAALMEMAPGLVVGFWLLGTALWVGPILRRE